LAPQVSLGYSSASVDGRTKGTNGQPSWLGEGFGYDAGYVERSYRSCGDDNSFERDVRLYPQAGSGVLTGSYTTPYTRLDGADVVFSPGDFTGDGRPDVIYRREDDQGLELIRASGAGTLQGFDEEIGTGWQDAEWVFSPGDFSGDGKPDLVWRNKVNQNLYTIAGDGAGHLSGSVIQVGTNWSAADIITSVGDFSGDGKPDVLYRNASDTHLYMMKGNGANGWASPTPVQVGTFWTDVDLIFGKGDFSGDAKPDVLYRKASNQQLFVVRGNGLGTWIDGASLAVGTATSAPGRVFAGGDLSGDGLPDLIGTANTAFTPAYPNTTEDKCWRTSNARISFGSRSAELVLDDATGKWRLANDDNSRIELLTGATNGDNDGEHWKLTTTDGTQYFFGLNRLPGWTSGNAETGSALTVPVFANHTGEPCFNPAGFASSWCAQAWRWNLDYVVDPHGNSMSYWYTKETNLTGLAGSATTTTSYDRAGVLTRVDYGTRTGSEYTTAAPAQVVFTTEWRCLSSCGSVATPTAANWPDTPWDLRCTASPCTNKLSPTFWTHTRLVKVTTKVWGGSAYSDVDEWALSHTFPPTGETATPVLWLSDIAHTGKVGGTLALPAVHLSSNGVTRNRADWDGSLGILRVNKYRLNSVDTETGGRIEVDYENSDCVWPTMPDPDHNSKRCFPQRVGGWSWWNKYRVSQVRERDMVAGSPNKVTSYSYSTAGSSTAVLWHHEDGARIGASVGLRSWSDFRGWPTVTVTTGAAGSTQTQSSYLYYRGLAQDRTDAGDYTRASNTTNSLGEVSEDNNALAGFLHERIDYASPGGTVLAKTVNTPWLQQTGHRVLDPHVAIPNQQFAAYVRTGTSRTLTWLAATSSWRQTRTDTTFDTTWGVPTVVFDQGDTTVATDDVCAATTYARNTVDWLVGFAAQTITTDCAGSPSGTDYLSGTQTFFDGSTVVGAAPSRGLPTKTTALASVSGTTLTWAQASRSTWDSYGRILDAYDPLDRKTSTAYTPATGGPVTAVSVTNPALHVTTTVLNPAWGVPETVTDANLKVTTGAYDPLGRLLKVWLPGQPTGGTPNTEYLYNVRGPSPAAASSVTTKQLGPTGTQIVSHQIYDGLLRVRQTQVTAPDGKRTITDTGYDSRSLTVEQSTFYNNASGPTDALVSFTDASIASQTQHLHDGRGRETAAILMSLGVEKWRTSSSYDGDRVSRTPPAGGAAVTTVMDARGRLAELRQYQAGTPTGLYDAASYGYDRLNQRTQVTDAAGNHWDTSYDLRGRVTGKTDPDTGASSYTYDDAGQLLTATDARPVTLAYGYDELGRKTGVYLNTTAGTQLAGWTYDTIAKGTLTASSRFVSGNAYVTAVTSYDNGYRPLGVSVTVPPSETGLAGVYTFGATLQPGRLPGHRQPARRRGTGRRNTDLRLQPGRAAHHHDRQRDLRELHDLPLRRGRVPAFPRRDRQPGPGHRHP